MLEWKDAVSMWTYANRQKENNEIEVRRTKHTGIVGIASKDKTPRETSAQLELHSGIVQDSRARRTDVRSEDGIIEPSSRVVGIDVEVVMVGKIRLGGLEPEGLSCVCVSGGDGVGGDNDGSEEERESREKLHFDYCCGYCLLFFFFSGR